MPEATGQEQENSGYTFEFGQFSTPSGAELLESTEFKNDGVPYMVERRYKLPSGQIMYAYYDIVRKQQCNNPKNRRNITPYTRS